MPDLLVCLGPVADVGVAGMVLGPLAVTLIVPDHEKVHVGMISVDGIQHSNPATQQEEQ